jgi:hypothetical protein
MDCVFKGLNTAKCGTCQKCVGIEALILELGGSSAFAKRFSQYIFLRTFLDKIIDQKFEFLIKYHKDMNKTSQSLLNYNVFDKISKLAQKFIGDPFQIEKQFTLLEKNTFLSEFNKNSSPESYFKQVGEGYGFFFYYAALGATHSLKKARLIQQFGSNLGFLVALRDAIKDLKSDRRHGKYNPFSDWLPKIIWTYYVKATKNLQSILEEDLKKIKLISGKDFEFVLNSSQKPQCSCNNNSNQKKLSVFEAIWFYVFSKESLCTRFIRRAIFPEVQETSPTRNIIRIGRKIGLLLSIPILSSIIPGALATTTTGTSCGDGCCDTCCESCCNTCCESCSCCNNCCCFNCSESMDTCLNNCCDNCCNECDDSCCEGCCDSSSCC